MSVDSKCPIKCSYCDYAACEVPSCDAALGECCRHCMWCADEEAS